MPGQRHDPGMRHHEILGIAEHRAPFGYRRLGAKAEKSESGGPKNGIGDAERRLDDERCHAIGKHGHQHEPTRTIAGDLGAGDVVLG